MTKEIKNVLLVGRTGSGKSALANVLFNSFEKDTEFQEVFKEGRNGICKTEDIQTEEFEWERIKYRVIDTPGVGNTKLSEKEVIEKLREIDSVGGISQILFLVRHRDFTEKEKNFFEFLEVVVRSNISECVTIVRTEFPSFEDKGEREKDNELLIREVPNLFSSCKVIHVDIPSLNISGSRTRIGEQISLNREIRKESRNRLLVHLQNVDNQGQQSLNLWNGIIELWWENKELKKENKELKKENERLENQTLYQVIRQYWQIKR